MYVHDLYIDDVYYIVKILAFINDIPASALVKKTKGHTGDVAVLNVTHQE